MARGSSSKEIITEQILKTFDGAFLNGKEIRIPMIEDSGEVQIKIALTAAKTNVEHDTNIVATGDKVIAASTVQTEVPKEPTEEEKSHLQQLIQKFF